MSNASNTEKTQAKLDLLRADQATLIVNFSKLEKRSDDRDGRQDQFKETQFSIQRSIDGLNMRVNCLPPAA